MAGLGKTSLYLPPPEKSKRVWNTNVEFLSSNNWLGCDREHPIILEFSTKARARVYWVAYIYTAAWAGLAHRDDGYNNPTRISWPATYNDPHSPVSQTDVLYLNVGPSLSEFGLSCSGKVSSRFLA